MADFYTLEEAARVLGMGPEELQAKAQQREVRAFTDGGSWRFRVADVDELARRRGLGSDPDLLLNDPDAPQGESDSGSDDINLSEFQLGVASPEEGASAGGGGGAADDDLLLDDLSLPPDGMRNTSSTIVGLDAGSPMQSDVRLAPEAGGSTPSDSDVTLVSDDPLLAASSGSIPTAPSASRATPSAGSSGEIKTGTGSLDDSDFELTPTSVIDALQPESGSDFELTPLDADSDPVAPSPSDSDVTGVAPSASGINIGQPTDSGINLGDAFDLGDSIELAPIESAVKPSPAPPPAAARPAKPAPKPEKDVFDDTDFEVDAVEGDDRTAQLEAASDFDLDESDDASRVFSIDEDDVDQNAATALGPAAVEVDEDDEGFDEDEAVEDDWVDDAAAVSAPDLSGARGSAAASPVLAIPGATADWGGLWVGFLMVAALLMMLLAFVSMDIVRNLYAYRGETISSGLVRAIAGLMGG